MPNPPKFIRREQRPFQSSQLNFTLRPTMSFICDGVEYKIDYDEYRERVSQARECYQNDSADFDSGVITREQFDLKNDMYLQETHSYDLIDEDTKHCGSYDSSTKIYTIFMKRIIFNETIYYCDPIDRELYTYCGRNIGVLSQNEREIFMYADEGEDDDEDYDEDYDEDEDEEDL
jgi:hypothetical protein